MAKPNIGGLPRRQQDLVVPRYHLARGLSHLWSEAFVHSQGSSQPCLSKRKDLFTYTVLKMGREEQTEEREVLESIFPEEINGTYSTGRDLNQPRLMILLLGLI